MGADTQRSATLEAPTRLEEADEWLARFPEVAKLARRVYTPSGVREFMVNPMVRFGGRRAIDLLAAGQIDEVISVIAADYEGMS